MPDGNSLVATPQETTNATTGIGIAESSLDLANGIKSGDWVAIGLGAAGVGLEVLSMVIDPLGTLASYGVSWLIEHVRPLKEALDWFAGDPPVIRSFSETWGNVAAEVNAVAADYGSAATADTAGWTGAAGDSYRAHGAEVADALSGAATLADGVGAGVMIMGEVVAFVREFIRDMVGELVGKLITWALEVAATLGLATPAVVAQATAAIAKVVNKVADLVRRLVKTIGDVTPRLRKVIDKLGEIIEKLSKLGRKADGSNGVTTPNSAKSPDAPSTPDTTTPAGTTSPAGTGTPSSSTPDGTSPSATKPADGTGTTPDDGGTTPSGNGGTSSGTPSRTGDGSVSGNNQNPQANSRTNADTPTDGDPIDVTTGRMLQTQIDVDLPGTLPLTLVRAHRSDYRVGRWFGTSWASTLDQKVEITADAVHFAADDGMLLKFPLPGDDDAVLPVQGTPRLLARTEDGGYTITDRTTGRTLRFASHGGAQRPITAVSDRNGNRIDFDYDAGGTLTEIRHSGGYRIGVVTEHGLISALSLRTPETDIVLMRYRYDKARRLVEVVNSSSLAMRFEYDPAGRITRWEDRNGMWYRFAYDQQGRCVRGEGRDGYLSYTFGYDSENLVTTSTNSVGQTTTYYLNDRLQIVREVDPLGNATLSDWDDHHRLLARTDALGRTTRYDHDDEGNLTAITRPDGSRARCEYNGLNLPMTITHPDGAVWRQDFDDRGNLVAITDPTAATTRYSYDARGNVVADIDALGNLRRVETNAAGLPIAVTDASGVTTRYTRDLFGRITAVTDPVGGVTRFGWTVEGNPAWRELPGGATERWRYDGEGSVVEHIDALGQATHVRMAGFDLPVAETAPDGSRTEFEYDTELRLVAVTNSQGLVWRYEYDAAGNLVREVDFNGRATGYRHDAANQVVARTNGTDEPTRFVHDVLGRVVAAEAGGATIRFEYDAVGRMVVAVNADARVEFRRDRAGRVLAETCNGRTLTSAYDLLGRRTRRVTPSGAESTWEYDVNDRPVALHTGGQSLRYAYDHAGREVTRDLGPNAMLVQTWNADHRLRSQAVNTRRSQSASADRGAPLLQRRSYNYRADGHVSTIVDQVSGAREFELDPLGRATAVRGRHDVERYLYDAAGNITHAGRTGPEAQGAREYSGTLLRRAGNVRYEYDAQGRVVLRQRKPPSAKPRNWRYTWDTDDRLVGVVTPDGQHWRYRYDALGRRIAKQLVRGDDATVVEQVDFGWDGMVLAEQTSSTRTTVWDWEPDSFRPVAQTERTSARDAAQEWIDERFYAIVTDVTGTPSELIDDQGSLAWHAHTTLWGEALPQPSGGVSTPLRFPGQYHDPETGLNYNFHRYYDPETGRYQSADPIGLRGSFNPHAYVSNPLVLFDPLGLTPYRIAGTRGLTHSFDEHAAQWFGREVPKSTHLKQWEDLINRAAESKVSFDWTTGNAATTAHLARIDGKYFVVQFFKDGPRAGELATAFAPRNAQLGAMLRAAGIG